MRTRGNRGLIGPQNLITAGSTSGMNHIVAAYESLTSRSWPAISPTAIDMLAVAGGGSGGSNGGGGGGAGGLQFFTAQSIPSKSTYVVSIGAGGAVSSSSGSNTSFGLGVGSVSFNGSTQYLTIPYNISTAQWWDTDYTIEAWVYNNTNAQSVNASLPLQISYGTPTTDESYWAFGTNALGKLFFYYYNGGPVSNAISSSTVPLSSWNHIAMVYTSSNTTLKGYINGVEVFSVARSGTPQAPSGKTLNVGIDQNAKYNGIISNLRIVKGTAVYTSNFIPSTIPLTAISGTSLLLNTASGSNFLTDSSTNNFTVTNVGTITSNSLNPFTPSIFTEIVSLGGGGGALRDSGPAGKTGGSGGGGADAIGAPMSSAGSGTAGQGNAGGAGSSNSGAGGGGGAGAVGQSAAASSSGRAGNGGVGLAYTISGSSTYYAGGGGGKQCPGLGNAAGTGGLGGGGNGLVSGTVNTGGGAGGDAAAGGSGIVIIRHPDSFAFLPTTGSPTQTTLGGYRIYRFTSSGSITF